MTIAELIEELSELPQDAEIRLATQPSYPLAAGLRGPVLDEETNRVWVSESVLPRDENPYEVFEDAFEGSR